MMVGDSLLYDLINSESTITDLLDSFAGGKAIFNDIILPSTFDGKSSINLYLVSPINGALEYKSETYSVNCRAETYREARAIAVATSNFLNRYNRDDIFLICNIQTVIQPENKLDTMNIVLEVSLKKR